MSNLYEVKTTSHRLLIKNKLINLKMEKDMPMEFFSKFVVNLLNRLASFGEKIVDDVVVKMILNALLEIYKYYV